MTSAGWQQALLRSSPTASGSVTPPRPRRAASCGPSSRSASPLSSSRRAHSPGSLATRAEMEPRTTHDEASGYHSQGNSGDDGRSERRWEYLRRSRESPKGTTPRDYRRSDPHGPTLRRRTDSGVYGEVGSGGHLSPRRPRSPPRTAHRCADPGPAARNPERWDRCAASGAPSSSGGRVPRLRALACSWRCASDVGRAFAAGDSFRLPDARATCVHLPSGVPSKTKAGRNPIAARVPILRWGHN